MVGGRGQGLRVAGHVHQAGLQHRRQSAHAADRDHRRQHRPRRGGRQREHQQHRQRPQQHQRHRAELHPVEQPAAGQIAEQAAQPECAHRHRDPVFGHAGDLHQGQCQIAEDAEHAGEADRADAQRQPHLRAVEGAQFAQRRGPRLLRIGRQQAPHQHHRQHRDRRDQGVGIAPFRHLAEPGRQRVADQHRQVEAEQHPADRRATLVGRTDRRGHQGRHTEIGAMRQAGDEARQQHAVIVRRHRAGEIAERIEAHQRQQQIAPRPARAEDRQQRRTDHHAQRIGTDQMPDLRRIDDQTTADVRHQPHGGELAGADRETAHRQREQDQHVAAPRQRRRGG
ncbi:hypothetical protein NB706_002598 [Xanthomonas sacchari]|nr:hypothetical protein [Xanthomonas sacchari]